MDLSFTLFLLFSEAFITAVVQYFLAAMSFVIKAFAKAMRLLLKTTFENGDEAYFKQISAQ